MPVLPSNSKSTQADPTLLLEVLSAVDHDSRVTQRSLSSELGIALGLANAVLKRCVRKGLIKIRTAPLNRYAYYLTPSGLQEKSRLTAEYLRISFDLFRDARAQYADLFEALGARGANRVALLGASELAEAAILSAHGTPIRILAIVDGALAAPSHLGVPAVASIEAVPSDIEALIVCDMRDPTGAFARALDAAQARGVDASRVVAPALLRVRRSAKGAP
ncbi:MAG: winged helix-turn-helix transcriptional regulator [Azospirillum sp.]|nr:winged helix-turn-helix transcriptional regulator [Azospirillum sp.]